tara:strand:- start:339 stop:1556 length:1218 start_codon:yes stop_codon:yes gene_type:complete
MPKTSNATENQLTEVVPMEKLIANNQNFREILMKNKVAILPLTISEEERNIALENTNFYDTSNSVLKEEYKIAEPSIQQKLNPKTIKNKAPDAIQGWIHQYWSPIHNIVQQDLNYRYVMNLLNNENRDEVVDENSPTPICHKPGRMRYCKTNKQDRRSLHFDGKPFKLFEDNTIRFDDNPIISTIIGLSGIRRFTWWDLTNKNLKPIYDYWKRNGEKNFTFVNYEFMNTFYSGCRKMVDIDCSTNIYLMAFLENTPHEISYSPSLSLHLSPIKKYNNEKINTPITFQAIEFKNLTQHETDLLALCYKMGGSHWPSGKKLYQSYHVRAYGHFCEKTKNYYKDDKNKHQMRLINIGKVDQHTKEYQEKLKSLKIKLPSIAFHENTPNFVIDITELPEIILKDYGFIE